MDDDAVGSLPLVPFAAATSTEDLSKATKITNQHFCLKNELAINQLEQVDGLPHPISIVFPQ